jgi:hypothetical protein
MSQIHKEEREKPEPFIIDFLGRDDDDILAPFSNRFNLKAANLSTESASTSTNKKPKTTSLKVDGNEDEKLEVLKDGDLLAQFKTNKTKRKIIISESTYDEPTLWRIHDISRGDGSVARTIDTIVNFAVGRKRTTVMLDTNDYYDSDTDEHEALTEIKNNDLYRKYVRGISKINKLIQMNEYEKMILTNGMIFGKGALLIEFDQDPATSDTAMPTALKPLSSLRIGRVFYYEDTWELAGIEYLDFAPDEVIVEANRLIYFVNKDYHVSPRTLWHGYSMIEPVMDIAETTMLNNQTNIKEINRKLWASFLIIKYTGKRKSDIDKFKKNYKPGMPIISNRDFEAQVVQVGHDLDKLMQQQEMSDQKIVRDLNLPNILGGFGSHQAQATAGAELHSWLSSALETRRTHMRNVFEGQWINPLLKRLIILNGDTMETLKSPIDNMPDSTQITPPQPPTEQPPQKQVPGVSDTNLNDTQQGKPLPVTPVPVPSHMMPQSPPKLPHLQQPGAEKKPPIPDIIISNIKKDPSEIVVEDLPFKIKMQFASFSVSTILDTASTVIGLKKAGLLDLELGLTELDRKEYIPHMEQIEAQNQAIFEQMQQGMNPFDPNQSLQNQPGFKNKQQQPNNNNNSQDNNSNSGPDASKRVDNIIANKTQIANKSSKPSAGGNRSLRTL